MSTNTFQRLSVLAIEMQHSEDQSAHESEQSTAAAKDALAALKDSAIRTAHRLRKRSDAIYEALGMATSETVARELLERAKAENDAIRAELGCGEGDPLETIRNLKNRWSPFPITWPTYAEISTAWFGHAENVSVDASRRVLDLFWDRVMKQPPGTQPEQLVSGDYKFDSGLVERLVAVFSDAVRFELQATGGCGPASGVRAILTELTKSPCELPTKDEYATTMRDSGLVSHHIDDWTRPIEQLVSARVAPALAAKAARIAELEKQIEARLSPEELNSERVNYESALSNCHSRIAELEKRLAELAAPISVDGKTPGQVDYEAYGVARFGQEHAGSTPWDRLGDKIKQWNEAGAQAVLRAFGGAALRRARERVLSLSEVEAKYASGLTAPSIHKSAAVRIIDAELAKLGSL